MFSRRRFIAITAGTVLGCALSPVKANTVSWRGIALGARAKLIITGLPEIRAKRLINLAKVEINYLENIFSIYRKKSVISILNETGFLRAPPHELLELLTSIETIHTATNGMFDPTIQKLWQTYAKNNGGLKKENLSKAISRIGWRHVKFDTQEVRYKIPDMAMTFNGIAQGFITDRVTRLLKSEGLENAVVNMGEIAAIGHRSGVEPWPVGISVSDDGNPPEEYVPLINQAIATSAPDGTTFAGGASHIIDPRSGKSVSDQWRRVSVIHNSATFADGLSTALVGMEEANIRSTLQGIGDIELIAQRRDGTSFKYKT